MFCNVCGCGIGLLDRHRKLRFRRGSVTHKDKCRVGRVGQIAEQAVVSVLAAEHPSATMKIHDNGQWTSRSLWTIDTYRNCSGRSNRQDFFFYFRRQLCDWRGLRFFEHLAGIGVGELIDRLSTLRCERVDECLSLWFKDARFRLGHGNFPFYASTIKCCCPSGNEAISAW